MNPTATASDSQQNYQNTQESSPEQLKNIQEEPYIPAEGDQQMYGNVQNGENSNNWEEGHMNDYGDGSTETQGTGIKEDG